jgi:hypothetical protein
MKATSLQKVRLLILMATLGALVLVGIFSFTTISAQSISDDRFLSVTERDIILRLSPEYPDSNEVVNASLSSYAVNLQRLRISWLLNGQVVKSGVGETTFSFVNGQKGSSTQLDIFVQISDDTIVRKSRAFSVSDIDLIWQAIDSYTPPFSRLRKLPARESIVRIVALPNLNDLGVNALQNDLVYNWERNGDRDASKSGYGASSYTFKNDLLMESEDISVVTSDRSGGTQGSESITVNFVEPELVLYSFPQGRKVALRNFYDVREEGGNFTLVAEPYFYSVKPVSMTLLQFEWFANNEPLPTVFEINNQVELQAKPGASRIRVGVEHPQKILQYSQDKEIIVTYNPESE